MADTSERIIILSFIILLFIASQSSIRENTRLEIDTDKPEYTVGERVKLTFYIVNPNPVPVKIEPYNIFEIDVFLNNIPQDGAFTAHNQWESGAMITIPPESRHKIDDMTFVANDAGNLTINLNIRIKNDLAGSARHTVQILEPEREYQVLWDGDIEVADPRFLSSDKNESLDMSAFQGLSSKLRTLVAKGIPEVKNFYVHYSMDWQNGTANIVLTDTSENVTRFILDQFSPPVREKIRFLKSPAPLSQIREWRETLMELCLGCLKERGVKWTAMGTYYDGRIRLHVEEITPETIDIIEEVIEGSVPPGIIVIWESDPMTELNDQDIDSIESSAEGTSAIQIGRNFLDGEGFKTGKVLSIELEEKEPNFYWDYALKFERPDLAGLRTCWVIRFEQNQRPGHYFEIWIDAFENTVIGGSQCR